MSPARKIVVCPNPECRLMQFWRMFCKRCVEPVHFVKAAKSTEATQKPQELR